MIYFCSVSFWGLKCWNLMLFSRVIRALNHIYILFSAFRLQSRASWRSKPSQRETQTFWQVSRMINRQNRKRSQTSDSVVMMYVCVLCDQRWRRTVLRWSSRSSWAAEPKNPRSLSCVSLPFRDSCHTRWFRRSDPCARLFHCVFIVFD